MNTKIAGLVAALVLVLGLAAILAVRGRLVNILNLRLEAHGLIVARAVASHHHDALAAKEGVDSIQMIDTMVASDPEVLYVTIYDASGRVVEQSTRPGAPAERLLAGLPATETDLRTEQVDTTVGRIYEVTIPLQGTDGFVRVGLSETGVNAAIVETSRDLVLVTVGILLMAVLISLALARLITRPIIALQRAVRSTSLSNLPGPTEPQMDDEVGELTSAFNVMATNLARSRDALVAQNRELEVLNATAQAISGSLELEPLLRAALNEVVVQMHLQAGWVFLAEPHPGPPALSLPAEPNASTETELPLTLVAHTGLSEIFAREEARHSFGECVCLDVLESGECRVMPDMCDSCSRLSRDVIQAERLVCHASVPLIARDRVVGVLNVAADEVRVFRDDELRLLSSIGRQVGVAVENAWLWDQLRHREHLRGQLLERIISAQENERRRIALELHDQTGSSLASLGVGLRMLEDSTPLPKLARTQLSEIRAQVAKIASEMHQLALDLRPPSLDRLGLAEAVEQSVEDFGRKHGLGTDFQAIGLEDERLPADVETALYRIIQEALTNIAKHAQASDVGVVLERRADSVVAVIEDNGRGFELGEALAANEGHLGLFGMQEHAALVGGRWQVESSIGMGATVFVEVPIDGHRGNPAKTGSSEG